MSTRSAFENNSSTSWAGRDWGGWEGSKESGGGEGKRVCQGVEARAGNDVLEEGDCILNA